MSALGNNTYKIRLILYFDQVNGNSGALDNTVNFNIFRNKDNRKMDQFEVAVKLDNEVIEYGDRACGSAEQARTRILTYEKIQFLNPNIYNEPAGYYIMWERCCRNRNIINLARPSSTGQTFVMYFPPVVKDGLPFLNSSPVFRPVPTNFLCLNLLSTLDFGATDADGDSLVFELVNPLKSIGADSSSNPVFESGTPGPYPSVAWKSGYSSTNQIPGNPKLRVDAATGLLSVNPSLQALFVYSVSCSEYRNGIKIGEIRREFQQLIIDCPTNTAPKIFVRNPSKPILIGQNDTLFLVNSNENAKCIEVKISDLQVGQTIKLQTTALNFIPVGQITGDSVKLVTNSSDTIRLSFCLPACSQSSVLNPFKIRIIAKDNGCQMTLSDTLFMNIVLTNISPPAPSVILSPLDSSVTIKNLDSLKILAKTTASTSQTNSLRAEAYDVFNNPLSFNSLGFSFSAKSGSGPLSSRFEWKAPCVAPANQPIKVVFITESSFCGQTSSNRKTVFINTKAITFSPVIFVVGEDSSLTQFSIEGKANENRNITLEAVVPENQNLVVSAIDDINNPYSNYGITFPRTSGFGKIKVPLVWNPTCFQSFLPYPYTLKISAVTDGCADQRGDSICVNFFLEQNESYINAPQNLFTTNGDGKNDYFSLDAFANDGDCKINFELLEIFNRWGKREFSTTDPAFKWPTVKKQTGTYFYFVKFKEVKFNGWFQLID